MGEKKGEDQITEKRLHNSCCAVESTRQFCHTLLGKTSLGSREPVARNRTLAKYIKNSSVSQKKNLGKEGCPNCREHYNKVSA